MNVAIPWNCFCVEHIFWTKLDLCTQKQNWNKQKIEQTQLKLQVKSKEVFVFHHAYVKLPQWSLVINLLLYWTWCVLTKGIVVA